MSPSLSTLMPIDDPLRPKTDHRHLPFRVHVSLSGVAIVVRLRDNFITSHQFHSKFHIHHIPILFLRRFGFSSISFLFARDWIPPSSAFECHYFHFRLLTLISHPFLLVIVVPLLLAPSQFPRHPHPCHSPPSNLISLMVISVKSLTIESTFISQLNSRNSHTHTLAQLRVMYMVLIFVCVYNRVLD